MIIGHKREKAGGGGGERGRGERGKRTGKKGGEESRKERDPNFRKGMLGRGSMQNDSMCRNRKSNYFSDEFRRLDLKKGRKRDTGYG